MSGGLKQRYIIESTCIVFHSSCSIAHEQNNYGCHRTLYNSYKIT